MLLKLTGGEDVYEYSESVLPNGIRLLVSRKDGGDKAAVSLSVKVGGFSDPAEFSGMAHFLEHMLFMGTTTHPDENYYMEYISKHNGMSNAMTCDEATCYYYDIDSAHLEESIDVFSGFFKCPLLLENSLNREVNAVASEHSGNILSEAWRTNHLITLLSKEETPMSKFQTGNLDTLKHAQRKDLEAFWKRFYTPERMCLVIHGKEPLAELEEYALKYFGGVVTHPPENLENLENPENPETYLPPILCTETDTQAKTPFDYYTFRDEVAGKLIRYRPAITLDNDHCNLSVIIALPESRSNYKNKTVEYIAELLEGQGSCSFASVLLLSGISSEVSVSHYSTSINTIIEISISLTDVDESQIGTVSGLLLNYIELARCNSTEAIYNTFKTIYELKFKNIESQDPIDHVETLSLAMLIYATPEAGRHAYIWDGYDHEEFIRYIDIVLDRSKWITLYRTPKITGTCIQVDKYYGINYTIEEFPAAKLTPKHQELKNMLAWSFFVPQSRSIGEERESIGPLPIGTIVTDIPIHPQKEAEEDESFALFEEPGCSGYLVQNKRFNLTEAQVLVYLETADFVKDPKTYAGFSGYLKGFKRFFDLKYKIEMEVSTASVYYYEGENLVAFHFIGPPLLIEDLVSKFLLEYTSKNSYLFTLVKETAISHFQNQIRKAPYQGVSDGIDQAFGYRCFDYVQCAQAAGNLVFEDAFTVTSASIKLLFTGNLTEPETKRITKTVTSFITPNTKTFALTRALDTVKLRTENTQNRAVGIVHQITGFKQLRNHAIAVLLKQIRAESFFDEVRTKENFGYVVNLRKASVSKEALLVFTVQSSKPFDTIKDRILAFIEETAAVLTDMAEEEYQIYKTSAIASVKESVNTLTNYTIEVADVWADFGFNLNHKAALSSEIASIEKTELIRYTKNLSDLITIDISHNNLCSFTTPQH
ncbi:insulysin [Nematocida displodere]|uniref:Insulysin n=1 Tax=Nematocida displodere TaxID=1805483 RepID=A0A177EBT8_9MICR|nr:insulysin [Nematocida displodere]